MYSLEQSQIEAALIAYQVKDGDYVATKDDYVAAEAIVENYVINFPDETKRVVEFITKENSLNR